MPGLSAPPDQPLANTRPVLVSIALPPLDEQRSAITPEAVGRVSGIAMVDGQLTGTIRHLPSGHEVRAVPLFATDIITMLGVGWASAMGLPPAEMEVTQQAYPQFHWGPYIEAAEELSVWIQQAAAEASDACRQRLFAPLHPLPQKLSSLRSLIAMVKLFLHEVPMHAPGIGQRSWCRSVMSGARSWVARHCGLQYESMLQVVLPFRE